MYEIERRFLVINYPIEQTCGLPAAQIRQTYLEGTGDWAIRARITTSELATGNASIETTMTMKRHVGHAIRIELEDVISQRLYDDMLVITGAEILKTRIKIKNCHQTIDFDYYQNPELRGLMIAEIELSNINDPISIPSWFDREITGEEEYSNYHLFQQLTHPTEHVLT